MSLLTFHNLGQFFGNIDIFSNLSGSIPHQAKIGIVGPNGIGKTTLLRLLAGQTNPARGVLHWAKGASVGYLHQEAVRTFAHRHNTVYAEMESVFARLQVQAAQMRQMEAAMSRGDFEPELLDRYGALQEQFELAGGYNYDVRIQQVLTGLGFGPEQWDMPIEHCSGGQKTRALLARLLLEKPDLLILDEPTNHLDVAAIEWLENYLRNWSGTLLIVSHDRYFLDSVVDNIWEMSRNGLETYRGNYSAYLRQREERWTLRDEEFTAVQERFLKKLEFIKRNIARASSSDRAQGEMKRLVREVKAVEVGGLTALHQSWSQFADNYGVSGDKWNVAELEQRIKALENPNPRRNRIHMELRAAHRSGDIVLRTHKLRIGYPGTSLFTADDIELRRRECAALIGPNGAGKSTFLRTLLGEIEPLNGRIRLGASLQISYFAQAHEQLNPERTVLEELLAYRNLGIGAGRSYLAHYLFRGNDVFKPITALSGGERGRLALALMALDDGNFLVLDEPTNHLDMPAQETLQDALQAYRGTVLLVSHDRYLINRLATQIWEIRDGRLHVHKGDYGSYLATRASNPGFSRKPVHLQPTL